MLLLDENSCEMYSDTAGTAWEEHQGDLGEIQQCNGKWQAQLHL